MTGILAWWDGIPGLDYRYPPAGDDILFADRFAALACAMRVCGTEPSAVDGASLRHAANVADRFLEWFQKADPGRDGYIRRLTLAIACTSATGRPKDPHLPSQLIRIAERYRVFLTLAADKRGGWI